MRALLVEKDLSVQEVILEVLEDRLHRVTVTRDEDDAWEIYQRERPSLVVLSWTRQSLDGLSLLARIRSASPSEALVFALVPADDPDLWEAAVKAGANDYIPRPVDPRLLEWRLAIAERESGEFKRRRRAEDDLLRLGQAVATMQMGMTISDLSGIVVFANPAAASMLGYSPEELLGQSARIFAADPEALPSEESLENAGRWSRTRLSRRKDGTLFPVRLLSDLIKDSMGKTVGLVTTSLDVTDSFKTRDALLEFEHRYRSLVETANDVIGIAAPDGTITTLNPAFERLTGFACTEWLGRPFAGLLHPDDLPAVNETVARAFSGGRTPPLEARLLTKEGTHVDVEYTLAPLVEAGVVSSVLAIARDVTERKRTENLEAMQSAVIRVLSMSESLDDAVPTLLGLVSEMLSWPIAEYWEKVSDGNVLRCLYAISPREPRLAAYAAAARGSEDAECAALSGHVAQRGTPFWVRDIAREPDFSRGPQAVAAGLRSAVAFPVAAGAEVVGVMKLLSPFAREPDDGLLEIMSDIGRQLGHFVRRCAAESALRQSQERFALAVQGANDGIWDWNLVSGKVFFSPRWKLMLGHDDSEIDSSPSDWLDRIHPEDHDRVLAQLAAHLGGRTPLLESEYRIRHRDGSYRWVLTRGAAVRDAEGAPIRIAGSQTDTTDRRGFDALTMLPNRALFLEKLEVVLARARHRTESTYAVLFLDLDRFKSVNDTLGHLAGDQLLIALARRLEEDLRPGDTVSRFGGDEFAILLDRIRDRSDALAAVARIKQRLLAPFLVTGREIRVTASVGIALGSDRGDTIAEQILREADEGMYRDKVSVHGPRKSWSDPDSDAHGSRIV